MTRKLIWTVISVIALATSSPTFARGGNGNGAMGGGPGFSMNGLPPGFGHGNRTGWKGASSPPGWSHGNKHGWNGHSVPPGLYGR